MPTSTLAIGKLIMDQFKNASMMAKLGVLIGLALVYSVLVLYRDMNVLNGKISDCHEARVKDITAIYEKQIDLEYKVRYNAEKIQETTKEVHEIKSEKISAN